MSNILASLRPEQLAALSVEQITAIIASDNTQIAVPTQPIEINLAPVSHDPTSTADNILAFMKPGQLYAPTEIATGIGLKKPHNTAKSVNRHLYALASAGKIVKVADEGGANPRWKLV